jgi:hypothetical protein
MRSRLVLGLFLVLGIVACGDGGDGDDPKPKSTPTRLASPTLVPTLTPTPRATAVTEVLLGTGRRFATGGATESPVMLRNDGGGWVEVGVAGPDGTILNGLAFSTPEVAWAFGFGMDGETPVLLRSADAGLAWTDVAGHLPDDVRGIDALAFESPEVGYLVSHRVGEPATFFTTRDGGATWGPLALRASSMPYGSYAFAVRGRTELVRSEEEGLSMTRLDDFTSVAPVLPSNAFRYYVAGINTVSAVDAHAWIAVATQTGPYTRARIVSNVDPERHWPEQRIDFIASYRASIVLAIDVRDDRNGVAGGAQGGYFEESAPLALVMAADGSSWREASVAGLPGRRAEWTIVDVLRARADGAWAMAVHDDGRTSAFLRSDDGGETWQRIATSFEADVQLVDLTRNTTVR